MAQTVEGASQAVELVHFSVMTDDDVQRHSVVKITNPNLLDSVGRPVPGGLYDPMLGPLDDQTLCKSCGKRSFYCSGHCGHIDLVSVVYNPLLFDILHLLLKKTCFFCHHFRASRNEVERIASQLEFIAKGDIVAAKSLDSTSSDHSERQNYSSKHQNPMWTSLQFTEAMSVLNNFFKPQAGKTSKCLNCEAKNPKISKPTFGWLYMDKLSTAHIRQNIIRGCNLLQTYNGGTMEKVSSEVVNDDECSLENDVDNAETNSFTVASNEIEDSKKRKNPNNGQGVAAEFLKENNSFSGPLLPSEVRDIMKLLWENEAKLCNFICNIQQKQLNSSGKMAGHSMFFLEAILVPPIKFRPASKGGDSVSEHPHTVLLGKVLQSNIALGNAYVNRTERSRIVSRWMDLQQCINVLFDSKTSSGQGQRDAPSGICQLIEKKEGIFRQKMMGKRVNFACRSVISPDPYLAVNEIGIPPYFALRLTYPERVTPWNTAKLRDAIINGPEVHPGATHYADKVATVKLPLGKKMRVSISRKLPSSRGVIAQSGKSSDYEHEGKIVYRHLQDGDVVLVNRQPTLHKPSIMAHIVRVLKGEKTLRMHYANCSSYNADFDGDEMNVHLPQDEVSRAEAYNIVNANNQYIVPTRGDTVRGLIQDHIVSAVLLTMKNTFLTCEQFNQLIYASGVLCIRPGSFGANPSGKSGKISVVDSDDVMQPMLPAVWKPKPLWTGKQVITAVLNHLTRGCKPCTVQNLGKIPYPYFACESKKPSKEEEDNGENKLLVWKNELVRGVIDKAQFGQYGLVHTVQELYGPNIAGDLLSSFSRLFTVFLQTHGFTCGIDDLLILPHYDKQKKEELEGEEVGEEVHCRFVEFEPGQIGPKELLLEIEKAICNNGQSATASLDVRMKNRLRDKGSKINKELLLKGLLKLFPKNCISLMTISGAKGGTVNFQQISSSLGQQELEGKRVPRMVSGKTLPCFLPWDFASRAGGFITDCFLTGLRPQEYYFHCMAGREGLVDTAVKTSRSGYLQRCLVKNLECLKVSYDYTVRDVDGSIIQFYYGEDGVDVHQTSFLYKFDALADNQEIIRENIDHEFEYNSYIGELPEGLRDKMDKFVENLSTEGQKDFQRLIKRKYLSSLAHSGEPVGVIAAQSVGEPSTQMTLNTFHHAGRGEMNVTLGIPRLQEILMTASNDIKTPIMTCPLLELKPKSEAKAIVQKVKKITVADLIESMEVHLLPVSIQNNQICRIYKLTMSVKEHELVSLEDCQETLELVYLRELEGTIESHVKLSKATGIKIALRSKNSNETVEDVSGSGAEKEENDDDDGDGDLADERAEDLGSDAQKRKWQATDEMDYEDGSDAEPNEEDSSVGPVKENDQHEDMVENEDNEIGDLGGKDEVSEMQYEHRTIQKLKSNDGKSKSKRKTKVKGRLVTKETDRAIFVAVEGLNFEVHFRFTDEPHILLAQIAQKAAKKVYIKNSGKIEQCRMVEYNVDENTVIWNKDKKPIASTAHKENKKGKNDNGVLLPQMDNKALDTLAHPADGDCPTYWALKTGGVDFRAFWEMEDELDISYVYSNNIHAMLNRYGVEAARAALIIEVKNVFSNYGVKIDYRHLSLIAEYMTHSGGYRPMSRHGCIAESISPFVKMTFETASKFIVQSAAHGMTDNLEAPSARICLGLPVKMGTGCFDLMQKLQV